jgi:hypothetical protein
MKRKYIIPFFITLIAFIFIVIGTTTQSRPIWQHWKPHTATQYNGCVLHLPLYKIGKTSGLTIKEFLLFNRVLSYQEIINHYQLTRHICGR